MVLSLSGPFAIHRVPPPTLFYTPARRLELEGGSNFSPGRHVFVDSAPSHTPGYLVVGLASKQTPFGQGTHFLLPAMALRRASAKEIKTVLISEHPAGRLFRPGCTEAEYLSAILDHEARAPIDVALAKFVKTQPRTELHAKLREFSDEHRRILGQWNGITRRQADAVINMLD